MRRYTIAFAVALVAGCGGNGSTTVTTTSTPPTNGGSPSTPPPPATPPGDMGATGSGGSGGPGGGVGSGGVDGGTGSGGVDGGTGSACTDTQPVAVATAAYDADALAVDDTSVYFTAQPTHDGRTAWDLWRAPVAGGAAVEIGTTGDHFATYATVNATAIFTLNDDGNLLRWPKSGGAPLQLASSQNNVGVDHVVDAFGYVYYRTYDQGYVQIIRQPEDGGGMPSVIAFALGLHEFAFDPTHIWITSTRGVSGTSPDGSGGSSISIPSDKGLELVAVDDTHVFVSDDNRAIWRADKRDGAPLTLLAQSSGYPGVMRVDGGNLYVLASIVDSVGNHATITRYATDGSRADVLADRAGVIGDMVVRGAYVYYTFANDSAVYRVCK